MTHQNEFQSSGTSPTGPDFLVENHGSIYWFRPSPLVHSPGFKKISPKTI